MEVADPGLGPALTVVGMGMDRRPPAAAGPDLARADVIIGTPAHLRSVADTRARLIAYPSPFSEIWALLQTHRDQHVALLASGDPLLYGIGATLLKHLPDARINFHPNVSSVQAALARARLPCHEATVVSLHGRPLETLRARLRSNRLYVCLTDSRSSPAAIAAELEQAGFEESELCVAEALGTSEERLTRFRADAVPATRFAPLNVVVVETRGRGGVLPEFPGIADHRFSTDGETPGTGMLSKREVRLMALSLLAPRARETGWDVGAGCGGISVEWARWNSRGRVYAIERDRDRRRHLETNRTRFGVTANLEVVAGSAPQVLHDLPDPDAVYIGGGGADLGELCCLCWQRLRTGGRLVAAAVTEESRSALRAFAGTNEAHWCQLAVARQAALGSQHVLRPQLPVLLMQREKS